MTRPFSPAAERNSRAILAALQLELAESAAVLEIGSGTGQHAVFLGRHLPHLDWQPSDVAENINGIEAWVSDAALPNVLAPLIVDVLAEPSSVNDFDAVFSANTAHIMHLDAVRAMFTLSADWLKPGGLLALYGPFCRGGRYNTASNAEFDRALRQRDPRMGIRDIELLDKMADAGNMSRVRCYAMPANNHLAVWKKEGGAG